MLMVIQIVVGTFQTVAKGLEKNTGRIENQKKNRDSSDYSIIKIG